MYKVNEEYFLTWSHNMAYILGLWWADGHIIYKPRLYEFSIGLQECDRYILELIRKELRYEGPLVETIYNKKDKRTLYKLRIHSRIMVESIIQLGGIPNKSLSIGCPQIPTEFVADFLRGLFDGDGTICRDQKSWKCGIYSASTTLIQELQQILLENIPDIKFSVCHNNRKNKLWNLNFSVNNAKRFGKFIYDTPSLLFLYRKYQRFTEMGWVITESGQNACLIESLRDLPREELINLLNQGVTLKTIASNVGVHLTTLSRRLKVLGINWKDFLNKRNIPRRSRTETQEILNTLTKTWLQDYFSQGKSLRNLAEELKVERKAITVQCQKLGVNYQELGAHRKEGVRQEKIYARRKPL